MSFKLGGQKTNSTTTTTPNVPDWLLGPAQDNAKRLTELAQTDPSSYVMPADPLQTQASGSAANLGSTSAPGISAATGRLNDLISLQATGAPQISAASLLDNLSGYSSPYTNDVVNSTLADMDAAAGKTRAAQDLALAGAKAFGGSGAALTKSATEGELARARATQEAQLRDAAFTTGANLSNLDAGRRQEASTTNANLKMQNRQDIASNIGELISALSGQDANTRANIATQEAAGAVNRGIATDQATAPLDFQAWLEQMYQGLDPQLFTGQTSKTKGTGVTASAGFSYGGKGG